MIENQVGVVQIAQQAAGDGRRALESWIDLGQIDGAVVNECVDSISAYITLASKPSADEHRHFLEFVKELGIEIRDTDKIVATVTKATARTCGKAD